MEKVLLVDDDFTVIYSLKRVLISLGYEVTDMNDSRKAFELFKLDPEAFDLVITDMLMPFMDGEELTEKLRVLRPDIPIIICTGFSTMDANKAAVLNVNYIAKPFKRARLSKVIKKSLNFKIERRRK